VFVDASRPTMPNKEYPGAATRTLTTEIWYPAAAVDPPPAIGQRDAALLTDGAPYPLVVYSHGFIDRRTSGGFLARHLASHGYVVVSIDYPLSNGAAPGGPTIDDVPSQPGDISYVLDQVLADDPGNRFAGAIDADRIGLTGLSLGGLTSTLAGFHATLRDARVRAVAPIAGLACNFNEVFYGDLDIPLLTVHGDIDAILPFAANARTQFDNANSPRYLVTVVGASHTAFSDLGALININNPDDVGCVALGSALPAPGDTTLFDALGGPALGIVDNNCPLPCQDPTPRPTALRGARQLDLTVLAVYPFLEAYLRDDAAMRHYLETTLAAENSEIIVESSLP
ncbi:MAG: alpha/beta hydrolase family protein, partial [Candidatus Binatia bacterium]